MNPTYVRLLSFLSGYVSLARRALTHGCCSTGLPRAPRSNLPAVAADRIDL
ncbi:hypothetical protein [Leekyejoonella antrihumi]|uniref:hypothetical protein n=1 Tax=Leekyejoonella antrihumi TaxID=1660198 RepID=UPI0016493652|nr:hypothetical protein [Leekyejoonella antrihumi]